uniref:NEDD4-binding protein 2-like 2 n=1 Tax=Amazona collaria TaxID=241587 RepID=A0A8B9G9U1_9PSIT
MLHAESRITLLECQDEIVIEPCSKKMKSTEEAYENLSAGDNRDIQEEVNTETTSDDLIPVYASDDQGQHEMQKQEKIPTGVLRTLNKVLPENNLVHSETVQNVNPQFASINDTKAEEKGPFITNNVGEDNIKNSSALFSVNRNASDEDFFTSTEFIGPIYKPAKSNKQGKSGSCNEGSEGDQNGLHENRAERKEAKKTQTITSAAPEIDDELDQFYKEIYQLESENLDTNFQEKETETSQEQCAPYDCSQMSQEVYQCTLLGSPQPYYKNGQCFFQEQSSEKTSNEQQFVMETSGWKTENTFEREDGSEYWNYSVPEFRPAWQSAESFIIPQGPFPSRFNHQSCFQVLHSPPQKTDVLPSQNGNLSYKNYYDYHGNSDINSHGPLLHQSINANHADTRTTQVFRNVNNDQNGLQNNGFCETREECWEDPKAANTGGMHSFSSLQLTEERSSCSQKLLLILRGLPGSGKTTLSRVLLGESHDGIVFSTDDYFRQHDGYTYNAAQLGDAHDWNQKRAKQAMEQGKSPVIIDNTNTQAWEMKPYVEVALEKGYRVEFHEPDTWWKFDPEELEKEPVLKKNHRRLSTKAKQRGKQKRNKKIKGNPTEITKKTLGGSARHPIPDAQDTSGSEEDYLEEEDSKSLCMLSEGPEDSATVCEEQPNGDDESLNEAAGVSREGFPIAVSEVSTMTNSVLKNELPVESDSSLLVDLKPFSTDNLSKNAVDNKETNQRHIENLCRSSFLKISNEKNSIRKTEGVSEDSNMLLLSKENKLRSYQSTPEPDMEAKLLSLSGEGKDIFQCYNSNIHDNVPGNNTEDTHALKSEENSSNAQAFFPINFQLPTEKLQLGFNTQVSLSSWSENKFVGEQRLPKMRKSKQTRMNSSKQLKCCWSNEGLVKENHWVTVTEEAGNVISNGLSASAAGEVQFHSLVEARVTFMQCSSEVDVPRNDASPIASKRKRYRRIVNLAPKFNLPRQIDGSTDGGKEVPIKDDVPQKSVLEAGKKSFLCKDHREECEQNHALQEYSAPFSGTEATYSMPTTDLDTLLHGISCIHLGQSSPMPKYSRRVCVVSRMKKEQARALKQQEVVDKKDGESKQVSSEVTNGQPDILSSVKVISEYSEDSSMLASCSENMQEPDDTEPAETSQLEDNQDVNTTCSFLGLPLSLGFAFQLVQLFGSPGLPLESLLPDDYVVPLDWKVSKMIYLLWKTSVEEKQKTSGLQNRNALADDFIGLKDINENHQENQDSSETLEVVELFQGMIEGNIVACTGTGSLDAVSHQP